MNKAGMYTHKTHIKPHQKDTFLPCMRARVNLILLKVTNVTIIIKKRLKIAERMHMQSYKKLAKLRDETEFELKTLKRKWESQDEPIAKLILKQLEKLFELYEIE